MYTSVCAALEFAPVCLKYGSDPAELRPNTNGESFYLTYRVSYELITKRQIFIQDLLPTPWCHQRVWDAFGRSWSISSRLLVYSGVMLGFAMPPTNPMLNRVTWPGLVSLGTPTALDSSENVEVTYLSIIRHL